MKKTFMIMLIAFMGCNTTTTPVDNNYKLTVVVTTDGCNKDTLTCTYTATHKIEPVLADNHVFNSQCSLFIGEGSWDKLLATHVTCFKVLTNEIEIKKQK